MRVNELWSKLVQTCQLHLLAAHAHLPVSLQGTEFADLHATGPAFSVGWSATDFTGNDQLSGRITMDAHVGKIIKQDSLTSLCLSINMT